jgi:anthranilate phosphoribosyltransferase
MVREAIAKLLEGEDLAADEARAVLDEIMSGDATDAQIGAFLVAMRIKGETPEEITGFARTMREKCVTIETSREDVIDTCGTGGDALDTFNVSTAAALIAAAGGAAVAKHGNVSVSSQCGSADVLKALGVNIELSPERVGRCLDETGIGFLFAPALHPAMKHAIGPRRELGVRTVFNILGPLTNPAKARRQLLGVYSPDLTEPLATALLELGAESALVVHGMHGLDELSTLGDTRVSEVRGGTVHTYTLRPEDVGLATASPEDISGGTPEESAAMLMDVLEGKPGARRDIALLNAAGALLVAGKAQHFKGGVRAAEEAVDSGAAREKLEQLREMSRKAED